MAPGFPASPGFPDSPLSPMGPCKKTNTSISDSITIRSSKHIQWQWICQWIVYICCFASLFFSSYIWRTFFPVSFSRICTFILVISSYCIILVNRVWVARKFRSIFHSRYILLRVFVTNICDSIFYKVISSVLLLNTAIENNGIGQEIVSQRENVRLRVSRKSKQYVELYSTAPSFPFNRRNIVLFTLIFTKLYETVTLKNWMHLLLRNNRNYYLKKINRRKRWKVFLRS